VRAVASDGRRLERIEPGQLFVLHETLRGAVSPVTLITDADAEVLAIPASELARTLEDHPTATRDLAAQLQARRQALVPEPMQQQRAAMRVAGSK
jgi:CRP-like cAMP-binding protein